MTDMPTIGEYRGVALHTFQSQERIDAVVKPEIDQVFTMTGAAELQDYMCSPVHSPEARILAAARLTALSECAADKRLPRPKITLDGIRAAIAGLASHWADRSRYDTLFSHSDQAAPRPEKYGAEMEEYFTRIERERLIAAGYRLDSTTGRMVGPGSA